MLFLAGGNYSLKRDPISTACLLLSICPRYPSRTIDNQYNLQAFRHMYVLATENRALHTIDVDTGLPVNLNVDVILKDGTKRVIQAPGLLPELSTIREINVLNSRISGNSNDLASNSQYYPTSLVINKEEVTSANINGLKNNSHKFSQILIPPLLVKQMAVSFVINDEKSSFSEKEHQNEVIKRLLSTNSSPIDSASSDIYQNNRMLMAIIKQRRIEELLSLLVESKATEDIGDVETDGSLVLNSVPYTNVIVEA